MRQSVRVIALVTVALAVLCTTSSQGRAQDDGQRVFRGGVDLIQVDAYPTKDGKTIEGLTTADFQVFEDGKPQTIQQVEFVRAEMNATVAERRDPSSQEEGNTAAADGRNRAFVIYLDTYHVTLDGSSRSRLPLVGFLDRMLAPKDVFAVTAPQLRARDLVFVRSTTTLQKELDRVWIWGQQREGMQFYVLEPEETTLAQCYGWMGRDTHLEQTVARRREDLVLRNLEDLVTHLGRVRDARKTVVLITRGWQLFGPDEVTGRVILNEQGGNSLPGVGVRGGGTLSQSPAPGTTRDAWCAGEIIRLYGLDDDQRFRRLMELANRNNVAFYPVNPAGLETPDIMDNDADHALQSMRFRENSFKTIAENTGGLWGLRNDLDTNLRAIANDVAAYYLISYYSANPNLDGRYRRIEVKVRQPGVNVRARPGYVAAATAVASAASPAAASASRVAPALDRLARLDNPVGVYVQASVSGGALALVAELASAKADSETWAGGGDVTVEVADSTGTKLSPVTAHLAAGVRGARLDVPLGDSKGPWRATVKATAKAETLDEVLSVPAASAATAAENASMFRALLPARAPYVPAAEPQFRRTERFRVEWPVEGMPSDRSARLLDKLGQPLPFAPTVTERDTPAGRVLAVDLTLSPVSPGDYVVELSTTTGGQVVTHHAAIRVVR